jgi:NAD(P)-dependent dehydrogenase (short-subunit alcohol dehydrogenase family)
MKLSNRVAIITGASQGIGAAIARRFAEEGARVMLADILDDDGKSLAGELSASGHDVRYVRANVSSESDAKALVEQAMSAHGQVDILVNNAGILRRTSWPDIDIANWNEVLAVNLTGVMLVTKYVAEQMRARQRGSIVNIASIHAELTGPGVAAYAASKAGVQILTRSMAIELGPDGIRANAILPGYIRTPLYMNDANRATGGNPGPFIDAAAARVPSRRVGEPDDVSGPALFLASDESLYVNGISLAVDGGLAIQQAGTNPAG